MSDKIDRIKRAFALEQASQQKATKASELPASYEEITDEWLTAVICRSDSGAEVIGHALDGRDSGTSNRRRIFLTYNEGGDAAGLPPSVFCKATHELRNRILLSTSGIRSETTFYNVIRPMVDIEAPSSFLANYDPESFNSIIVLRDIADRVAFCTHDSPISRHRAEGQLALLAGLHGRFYRSAELDTTLRDLVRWSERFRLLDEDHDLKSCCGNGFLAARDVIPLALFKHHEEIWPATTRSVERHRALPHTVTHGDVHLKNWYVTRDGRMGLNDWQVTSVGHWSRDVAYVMSTSLTIDNRRAWEADLLRFYLQKLEEAGVPPVAFDDAWKNYRQQLFSVLAWWTVTLKPSADMPDMQPEDTTLEFIRRITHAIDDLEALRSF